MQSKSVAQTDKATIAQEVELKADLVAQGLATKRAYMNPAPNTNPQNPIALYDPRFLVFEFIHNLLLRESQVTLIIPCILLLDYFSKSVRKCS